jgi:hypothetical protein
MATLTPTKIILSADAARIGTAIKLGVSVIALDAAGKPTKFDLAELDDASAQAWLAHIKDWKEKLKYRQLLGKIRTGEKRKA